MCVSRFYNLISRVSSQSYSFNHLDDAQTRRCCNQPLITCPCTQSQLDVARMRQTSSSSLEVCVTLRIFLCMLALPHSLFCVTLLLLLHMVDQTMRSVNFSILVVVAFLCICYNLKCLRICHNPGRQGTHA